MMSAQREYQIIHERVAARYRRRKKALSDILVTMTITALMWAAWIMTDPGARMGAPLLLLLNGVMFLVAIHTLAEFVLGELEERALIREIEKEREWQLRSGQKAKNDERFVSLSEDGELEEQIAWDEGQQYHHLRG